MSASEQASVNSAEGMPENTTDPADHHATSKPDTEAGSLLGDVAQSAVEIATGLSPQDVEALKANADDDTRAAIAVKFAAQYDRLHRGKSHKLTSDLLHLFSKDPSAKVRSLFAREIRASQHVDPAVAALLARDDLEIASPILESCPALCDTVLEGIIKDMAEPHAIVIAGRQPLAEHLADMLLEHKSTTKVIARLIENGEAVLSETAFATLYEWGRSDLDIATRLERRPNLPFNMVQKYLGDLGEQLNWNAIKTRSMSKGEAAQFLGQIYGPARSQYPRNGTRLKRILQTLRKRHDAGLLTPNNIIALLRDYKIDLVELSFVIIVGLELKRVRNLLYGSDRRGLVALCLAAGFTTAEYLAFRMVLGLVELGAALDRPEISYDTETTRFAQSQFEMMRNQPGQIDAWMTGRPVLAGSAAPLEDQVA